MRTNIGITVKVYCAMEAKGTIPTIPSEAVCPLISQKLKNPTIAMAKAIGIPTANRIKRPAKLDRAMRWLSSMHQLLLFDHFFTGRGSFDLLV
jgi:hypothetical protein